MFLLLRNKKSRDTFKQIFNTQTTQYISLGYSCFPKMFLKILKLTKESELFDYNGLDAWGINELLKDNLPNPLQNIDELMDYDVSFVKNRQLKCKTAITNKKYFMRFTENFPKDTTLDSENFQNNIDKVKESYDRKIERMRKYLSDEKPIVFFYYEELNSERIIPTELKSRYPETENIEEYIKRREINEKESMNNVLETIKTKYNKQNISLIYFTDSIEQDFIENIENRTLYIKVPKKLRLSVNRNVPIILMKTVSKNMDNIDKFMNKILLL